MRRSILSLSVFILTAFTISACGPADPQLGFSADGLALTSSECNDACIAKGESAEDCVKWCSADPAEKLEQCNDACLEKGVSAEACAKWCSPDKEVRQAACYDACLEKGESEEVCDGYCYKKKAWKKK